MNKKIFPKILFQYHLYPVTVKLLVEPRDLWVGLYWNRFPKALDLYVCIVPVLPVNIYIQWR